MYNTQKSLESHKGIAVTNAKIIVQQIQTKMMQAIKTVLDNCDVPSIDEIGQLCQQAKNCATHERFENILKQTVNNNVNSLHACLLQLQNVLNNIKATKTRHIREIRHLINNVTNFLSEITFILVLTSGSVPAATLKTIMTPEKTFAYSNLPKKCPIGQRHHTNGD